MKYLRLRPQTLLAERCDWEMKVVILDHLDWERVRQLLPADRWRRGCAKTAQSLALFGLIHDSLKILE